MQLASLIDTVHRRTPRVGKLLSLTTASTVIAANSIAAGPPVWVMGAVKVLTGSALADAILIKVTNYWINSNNALIDHLLPTKDWRIRLPDDVHTQGKYLLICNHQSWVDTSIVQYISQDRLPLTRFFTKFELIFIPVIGQAFYFLDFPMMRRHSKAKIKKNPALKGKDIDEATRACALLKHKPFTLLNYLEGTRFTPAKHQQQGSPYSHLLKPRAGGLALAMSALGEEIDGILDMTIVYPDGVPSYSDLWQGNITRLGVDVRHLEIPKDLAAVLSQSRQQPAASADDIGIDSVQSNRAKRLMFAWVAHVWEQKEARITHMLAEFEPSASPTPD